VMPKPVIELLECWQRTIFRAALASHAFMCCTESSLSHGQNSNIIVPIYIYIYLFIFDKYIYIYIFIFIYL
jgi:hypothetical protein